MEYEIRSLGATSGNEGYVNVYMRADPLTNTGNDNFYDCRLDFPIQDTSLFTSGDATRELVIDHTTTTTSFGARNGFTCGTSPYSIGQYPANNPNAVFGVGNGELYTFTLDTGSTNQDNQGLEVCSCARQTFCIILFVVKYSPYSHCSYLCIFLYRRVGPML